MTATQPLKNSTNSLDVQVEEVSSIRRRLRFLVPQPAVATMFTQITNKYAQKVRVAGFRPGKAPAAMIERMHGTEIRRQVMDELLKVYVFAAIHSTDLKPVGRPEVESVGELARDKPLQVQVMCEVLPKLELTGYEGATLTVDAVVADDDDLQEALERKARERAEQVPVETGMQPGDEVVADWKIVEKGNETPQIVTQRRFHVGGPSAGHNAVPTEIAELVLTATVGQEMTVELPEVGTLPERTVTLLVHEASRTEIPAVDDELAKDLGHADLEALKAATQAEIAAEVTKLNVDLKRQTALNHVIAQNNVEVPPSFVEEVVDRQMAQSFGQMDEKTMRSLGRFIQQMRGDLRRDTEIAMRSGLVQDALVEKLGVQADDEAINAKLAELLAENPGRTERLKRDFQTEDGREDLRRRVKTERALDELVKLMTFSEGTQKTLRAFKAPPTREPLELSDIDFGGTEPEPEHEHVHVHDENCQHDH